MNNLHKCKLPRLCAISLPFDTNLLINIQTALRCGVKWIQYRAKDKSRRELYYEALKVKELTTKYDALLTINDYLDVAIVIEAPSIHLGQDDFPLIKARQITSKETIIGVSTHSLQEAKIAETEGADYIGFGSIFPTDTKIVGKPQGVSSLKQILSHVNIPVVAIGGIKVSNIKQLFEGESIKCSIAMSSGIFIGNVEENCKSLAKLNLI